jgi:hypothetical protein
MTNDNDQLLLNLTDELMDWYGRVADAAWATVVEQAPGIAEKISEEELEVLRNHAIATVAFVFENLLKIDAPATEGLIRKILNVGDDDVS